MPRRTARLRLTLLSGALFLLAGAAVLAITYLLFDHTTQRCGFGLASAGTGLASGCARFPRLAGEGTFPAAARALQAAQATVDRHTLLVDLGIALAIVAALALLLGWFVAGRMLQPVRTITATARKISSSNLHERLALDDADEEFKELGDTLDDLFARLAAAFDAQRHFVANASHELRSPLTRERTLLQVALEDPSLDLWQSTGQQLLASNREQGRLIEALLTLARSQSGLDHREQIDLANICGDVLLRPGFDTATHELDIETAIGSAPVDGDPRLIERLVANLVDNAVGHNIPGGHVHIQTTTSADGHAQLVVSNTGPEIPAAEIERLFEPFQRLKTTRTNGQGGYGLGLSIVQAIAATHHARLTAQPRPGGGLEIRVSFPAAATTTVRLPDSRPSSHESATHNAVTARAQS